MALALKQPSAPDQRSNEYSHKQPEQRSRHALATALLDLVVLLALGWFFCIHNIGEGSFGNGDQTDHSLVVQQIFMTGDWLHPSTGTKLYMNKPPLKMWISQLPLAILGETNFAYRLIDGLAGVGMGLMVFYFALTLFGSRGSAYLSVFALYGCHLFFFGHGVRNAVQDGLMNFFVTLSMISGWQYVREIDARSLNPRARSSGLLKSSVFVGAAAMCKSLGAFISWIVLGAYLLVSGKVRHVVWRYAFLAAFISVLPLGLYIAAQGDAADNMFRMLFVSEGLKRAIKGYHHVNRSWYYWKAILQGGAVPSALLVIASGFALLRYIRERDQRFLYLLCWALVPVLFYQCMRSKLSWYINPALPGMSILVGITVWTAITAAGIELRKYIVDKSANRLRGAVLGIFSVYAIVVLSLHAERVIDTIFIAVKKSASDRFVQDLRRHQAKTGKPLRVASFYSGALAKHEKLYFNSVGMVRYAPEREAEVKGLLERGEIDVLLTDAGKFDELSRLRRPESYAFLPARFRRRRWLAILSYVPNLRSQVTTPSDQHFDFAEKIPQLLYGWRPEAAVLNGVTLRASKGRRSAVRLDGNLALKQVPTELEVSLASNVPEKNGDLDVDVYLNETRITTLESVRQGFQTRTISIAPGEWVAGDNQLSFVYRFSDGRTISENAQLMLFDSLTIRIPQPPPASS